VFPFRFRIATDAVTLYATLACISGIAFASYKRRYLFVVSLKDVLLVDCRMSVHRITT